jgi:TRAP-type C4-dicarboxylate transport system permease small subunit
VRHDTGLPVEPPVELGDRRPPPMRRGPLARAVDWANRAMLVIGMIALLAASFILTFSVVSRYLFKMGTDWQDEAAVFCIVGTVFLCGAYVQAHRGHVGIEAISSLLSPAANRIRQIVVDALTLLFCSFFAWKSWTLWHEAWVDRMTTSSTWAPPLAIPYGMMAAGMTLLALQVLLQVFSHFTAAPNRR